MKTKFVLFLSSTLIWCAGAYADEIKLGVPGYGGTGCPAGSASVTLSPDQTAMSILFDQYVVEAGGATSKRVDRKACNVSIPVTVPQGWSISLFNVDYRGFNSLPIGAKSVFNVEYFFAGARGPRYSTQFTGPKAEDYTVSDELYAGALVWSACGAQTNLRINSSMMVSSNARLDSAQSTVDSADIKAGIVYHIKWKQCR